MDKIIISIPTYKRPFGVQKAVESLSHNKELSNLNIEILIVDNDPQKSAYDAVESLKRDVKTTIHYVSEPSPGLVNVRNKILSEATLLKAKYLLSFDDDEVVEKDWIKNHLEFLIKNNCTVSSGPTLSILPANCPRWIIKGKFFKLSDKKEDKRPLKTSAGGNFALDLDFVRKHNLKFDPRFNFCGGEDTDFFKSVYDAKGLILHNQKALAYEIIPAERCTLKYVLKRDFRIGNNRAIKTKKYTPSKVILKNLQNLLAMLFYIVLLPISIFQKHTLYKRLCKIAKTFGYFKGTFGKEAKAYGN